MRFFRLSDSKRLRLVLVYPGTGYGTRDYVAGRIENLELPKAPVLLAVADSYATPYTTALARAEEYATTEGLTLSPSVLVAWSGGVKGAQSAVEAGHTFSRVELADPSPNREAWSGRDTRIVYNPDNWTGYLAPLGVQQAKDAELYGRKAVRSELGHNEILDRAITDAVKGTGVFSPVVLVTAAGLGWWLWKRNP